MIKTLTVPDLELAVYDFIEQSVLPRLDSDNIVRGWQNYTSLPKKTNEYAVYTVLFTTRSGTNVRQYVEGVEHELSQYIANVQLDFCSTDESSMKRAACVATIGRSPAGVEFFKSYGIGCLYADDPKAVEYVDGEDLYIRRWIVTLRLSFWTDIGYKMPSFNNIKIKRVENVDAYHRPKEI